MDRLLQAPHFERYPNLNQLFNEATKLAAAAGTKGSLDPAVADELLGQIEEISPRPHRCTSPRLVITVRRQHRSKPYHRGQGSLAEAVA